MAISKTLIVALFLAQFIVLNVAEARQHAHWINHGERREVEEEIDCGAACAARCKLSSRQNVCMRACGTCCARCQCVPSGTFGPGQPGECPCYFNQTTHGGKPKCP